MKNVKILHLYSKSMDLYGDYKNLTVLCQRIRETGNTAEISTAELFDSLELDGYDMVYVGCGKARNLQKAAEHFVPHAEKVKDHIEKGQLWLVTGNARELFGTSFTAPDGSTVPGIGLFRYTGVETGQVYVSDMVGTLTCGENAQAYGFTNRTAYLVGENEHPLFRVTEGFCDGNSFSGTEGTLYHNFFGTWAMGPVLARNPALLREILRRLLGDDYKDCDYTLEEKALELVLAEFKKGE